MNEPFRNEPLTDFSRDDARKAMTQALERVKSQFGKEYDLLIGGQHSRSGKTFPSMNPSRPSEIVGHFEMASEETARRAVEVAAQTFETWKDTPAEERSRYLIEAARLMRQRKHELAAWMIYEVGKSWVEADADVAEAIDFCEFYARENLRLAGEQPLTRIPSERNELRYIPLGVAAVIPPWNFPLAILVGMTSAAIVTGNTVVLKPASYSPAIGYQFAEILHEVGLPPGVLNFVTGSGSVAGEAIVVHPKTRLIAFTGSMEVGLGINEKAARTEPGQIWIKRVIAEMGGKDTIIVDKESDLDSALEGVTASAFGYQGQKCSACSRVVVDESLYDRFARGLVERAEKIAVGPPEDPSNYMGPVVARSAADKILSCIEKGKAEGGKLLTGGGAVPDAEGYFIQPTIFGDVDPSAFISQEEIFGPVLAMLRARDYEQALSIANNTKYGLTGSVYTTDRDKIEEAKKRFHVGNLYFNRKCTGALVGVHPFGGFNMSGTDSKAGGRDYLLLFTQAKAISEKIK